MLAVKSGHTWNHSHADANSFIVFHKGVDIIKDGVKLLVSQSCLSQLFFQSQAHNVVLSNGEDNPRGNQQYSGSTYEEILSSLDAGQCEICFGQWNRSCL